MFFRYEKMISGMYMGEIARQVIHQAASSGLLFGGEVSETLATFQMFYSKYISEIEKYAHVLCHHIVTIHHAF